MQKHGLRVFAKEVSFTGNTWQNLAPEAFGQVHPGGKNEESREKNSNYTYQFSGNVIKEFTENSLLPDWKSYKAVFTKVIVTNNTFLQSQWWDSNFIKFFIIDTNNCAGAQNCSLQKFLPILNNTYSPEVVTDSSVGEGTTVQEENETKKTATDFSKKPAVFNGTSVSLEDSQEKKDTVKVMTEDFEEKKETMRKHAFFPIFPVAFVEKKFSSDDAVVSAALVVISSKSSVIYITGLTVNLIYFG